MVIFGIQGAGDQHVVFAIAEKGGKYQLQRESGVDGVFPDNIAGMMSEAWSVLDSSCDCTRYRLKIYTPAEAQAARLSEETLYEALARLA